MNRNTVDLLRTHLSRRIRLILMGGLITLFFVISPSLILYTAGWRFNFTTHTLESIGILSIDIAPKDTTVFLNDNRLQKTIPIRLSSLAPGTYRVRLENTGYHTWQKDISVQSNTTSYIKDIQLLKQADPKKISELKNSTTVNPPSIPTSTVSFVDQNNDVWEFKTGTIINTTNSKKRLETNLNLDKIIDIKKNFALVKTAESIYLITNLGEKNQEQKNIPALNWHWHAPTKEWRLASEWEITSVYENGTSAILYRSAEPIQSIHDLDEQGLLLIVSGNSLLAFNPGYYVSHTLAHFDRIDNVETDEINRVIVIAGVWHKEPGIFTVSY